MKYLFELTEEEQNIICNHHYYVTKSCGTCPLKIDGDVCTRDITNFTTTLKDVVTNLINIALREIDINDYIRMDKTEVGDKGESRERK